MRTSPWRSPKMTPFGKYARNFQVFLGYNVVPVLNLLLPQLLHVDEVYVPKAGYEKVNQVDVADGGVPDDALAVAGEEMRGKNEGEPRLDVDRGAVQALGPVIDAVILDERILPFRPLESRQLDKETVLLDKGLALIVPADRIPVAFQHHGLEFIKPVQHRPAGVLHIGMEFPVNLLNGHGVHYHLLLSVGVMQR